MVNNINYSYTLTPELYGVYHILIQFSQNLLIQAVFCLALEVYKDKQRVFPVLTGGRREAYKGSQGRV